jgi:hypothetical protein
MHNMELADNSNDQTDTSSSPAQVSAISLDLSHVQHEIRDLPRSQIKLQGIEVNVLWD